MILNRDIAGLLKKAMKAMPVVALTGPRQSGKTTLIREWIRTIPDSRYVSLDEPEFLSLAGADPDAVVSSRNESVVAIDEAQRQPDLCLAIKRAVDRDRRPGRFLLSGSANMLLLRTVADSLAGRAIYVHLWPMSFRELNSVRSEPLIVRLLEGGEELGNLSKAAEPVPRNPGVAEWITGGFPSPALSGDRDARHFWFTGYEQTYIERDLRGISQVADIGRFHQFMRLAAMRTAQVLNTRDLGRDGGLNAVTAARWLSLMETSFVVRRLPPYHSNRAKRLVKAPKLYMTDSGLAAHMAGIHTEEALEHSPFKGALAETYVCNNIAAITDSYLPDAHMFCFRTHDGHEVDFVIERGNALLAIEFKASSRVDVRDLKGLREFVSLEPGCIGGLVAYLGDEVKPLGNKLVAVPLAAAIG